MAFDPYDDPEYHERRLRKEVEMLKEQLKNMRERKVHVPKVEEVKHSRIYEMGVYTPTVPLIQAETQGETKMANETTQVPQGVTEAAGWCPNHIFRACEPIKEYGGLCASCWLKLTPEQRSALIYRAMPIEQQQVVERVVEKRTACSTLSKVIDLTSSAAVIGALVYGALTILRYIQIHVH